MFCSLSKSFLRNKDPIDFVSVEINKAFQRGSFFGSLSQPDLQNEDPIDFGSVNIEQSISSEGLRFVVPADLIYKKKTPMISCLVTSNNAFE